MSNKITVDVEAKFNLTGKYLNNGVVLNKKHENDAGLDIRSFENILVKAHGDAVVSTNLFIAIPNGCVGLIWPRSGLSINHKIETGAGCIDSNYRGEIKVHLYNHSNSDYVIHIDDKIAQLLTIPVVLNDYQPVDNLDDTDRGTNGFGSTGR